MDDRVGEMLARRASALDRGTVPAVALSVLLHGAFTAAALYAAWHSTPPQVASVLNIKFAPMPAMITAPAAPAKPTAPIVSPAPVPVAAPTKKPPPIEIPMTATPAAKAPPRDAVPHSTFGQSTKRGSEHVVAPPATPAPVRAIPGVAAAADVPVGGAGVTGLDADFPYTIYIENMKRLVGSRWFRPQSATGVGATVYFVVDRDGTIRDARIETASNNGTFDRAALRAIIESSPLPPLPFGYGGTFLGVHLTFK
ncbi:MAG: TonB family protein [Acidobacteriota bacterium]